MAGATLAQVKAHLRYDGEDEDAWIEHALNSTLAHLANIGVPVVDPVPAPIVSAQLLLVARLFANRGEALEGAFRDDQTWKQLVAPYREVVV